MKLSSNELNILCGKAIEAAKKAGALIADYSKKHIIVQKKDGGNSEASQVVTEVDYKSQELILEILNSTLEQYDLAVLTEENLDNGSRFDKDYFWCIDPLDGTLPFTESKPGYAVSIALINKNGDSEVGVVFDPVTNKLYHAVKNHGAFINENPWVNSISSFRDKPLHFFYNRSFTQLKVFNTVVEELKAFALLNGFNDVVLCQKGGAAMNACLALEMVPSCFFAFPKKEDGGGSIWDYGATACIYKEIGYHVSDIYGKPLELNRKDSSFMNKNGILYASNKMLAEYVQKLYTNM